MVWWQVVVMNENRTNHESNAAIQGKWALTCMVSAPLCCYWQT